MAAGEERKSTMERITAVQNKLKFEILPEVHSILADRPAEIQAQLDTLTALRIQISEAADRTQEQEIVQLVRANLENEENPLGALHMEESHYVMGYR